MKTLTIPLLCSFYLGLILTSCKHEQTEAIKDFEQTSIQFESAQKVMAENADEQTILLRLDKRAPVNGVLLLALSGDVEKMLTTSPEVANGHIRVPIKEGDLTASIQINPVDNATKDGNKVVTIRIQQVAPPFIAGTTHSIKITILDDELPGDYLESYANFMPGDSTLQETQSAGTEVGIHLSEPVAVGGTIEVSFVSAKATYNQHFITQPASVNDKLILEVKQGVRVISFKVIPVANEDITGDLTIELAITATTGSIKKGQKSKQALTITDDELTQKPKGYENTSGSTIVKKFYEYDEKGRIAKVNWESYTPYHTHGYDTYFYDVHGRLIKISKHTGKSIQYTWQNGRIIKSENVANGVVQEYTAYTYDGDGNISGTATHHRQKDGAFTQGMLSIYFYYPDGNIYKSQTYIEDTQSEEPILISIRTYEGYMDIDNPFPMVEILPVVQSQTKLATSYRVEENGITQFYRLSYEFRPDGLPAKRIASSEKDVQTAVYHYY